MSSIDSRPDRQSDQARLHAGAELLVAGQLAVRGRRRVDDERPHVADVGQVAVQLERLDEALPGLAAARRSRTPAPSRDPSGA